MSNTKPTVYLVGAGGALLFSWLWTQSEDPASIVSTNPLVRWFAEAKLALSEMFTPTVAQAQQTVNTVSTQLAAAQANKDATAISTLQKQLQAAQQALQAAQQKAQQQKSGGGGSGGGAAPGAGSSASKASPAAINKSLPPDFSPTSDMLNRISGPGDNIATDMASGLDLGQAANKAYQYQNPGADPISDTQAVAWAAGGDPNSVGIDTIQTSAIDSFIPTVEPIADPIQVPDGGYLTPTVTDLPSDPSTQPLTSTDPWGGFGGDNGITIPDATISPDPTTPDYYDTSSFDTTMFGPYDSGYSGGEDFYPLV